MTIEIETSKTGLPTAKLKIGEKSVYLHSKYDPLKEAERTIGSLEKYNANTVFILFGLGLGYHLFQLFKYIRGNTVIVIEPNEELYEYTSNFQHINPLLNQPNVISLIGNSCINIQKVLKKTTSIDHYNNYKVYTISYYEKIYYDFYSHLIQGISEWNCGLNVQINAINRLSKRMSDNIVENIQYILQESTITNFKDIFKDYPVVIVSAGPSLDKNIDDLKDKQDKVIILAGVRTLKPLVERGIIPHFLLNIDPQFITYELVQDYLDLEIPLISLIHGNHILVEEWKGPKIFIIDERQKSLIEYLTGKQQDIIETGGSVANASAAIADYMGCNPIILIGQDLAFTNRKHHSDIASNTTETEEKTNSQLFIEDINGNKISTSPQLYYYLNWFEEFIENHPDSCFVDATEGGAKIKGTEVLALQNTMNRYCKNLINPSKIMDQLINIKATHPLNKKLKKLKEIYKKLQTVKIHSKSNMELSLTLRKIYEGKSKENIKKVMSEMDYNDKKIDNTLIANELIFYDKQPELLSIAQEYVPKLIESEEQSNTRIIDKNEKLYKVQYHSVKVFEKTIKEMIEANEVKVFSAIIHIKL